MDVDPAAALRHANAKFERRFRAMERRAGGTESLAALNLEQMEAIWQEIKRMPGEAGDDG